MIAQLVASLITQLAAVIMAVASLSAQFAAVGEWFASNHGLLATTQSEGIVNGSMSLVHQLNNLVDLDSQAATRLNTAIASSAYSAHDQATTAAAVANKVVSTTQSHIVRSTGRARRACQSLFNPLEYFKQSAWDFKSSVTVVVRLNRCQSMYHAGSTQKGVVCGVIAPPG